MSRRFRIAALSVSLLAAFSFSNLVSSEALAAKKAKSSKSAKAGKKVKEVPGVVTEREKKILGWTSDYPTAYTYTTPDFFIRSTVVDFKQIPNSKEWEVNLLPIEVMNNPMHHVTMKHFKEGIVVKLELMPKEMKGLRKGGIVEFNQYSKEIAGDQKGYAKLVKQEIYTEFKPYGTSPVAYLNKPGMEPEQVANAIQGMLIYEGSIDKGEPVKTALASFSKDKNPELSAKAKECSSKLFGN